MVTPPPTAQPLAVGPLLQRSLDVLGRHAAVLLWCVVIVVTPLIVVSGAVAVALGSGGLRTYNLGATLMAIVGALGGLVGVAACMHVVARDRAGEPVSVQDALGFGLRRYPQVLAVTLIVAVAVFAGIIACIVPGIYLLVRWAMAVPALLIEGGDIGDVLQRAWKLVEHRWWITFGLLLAGYLLPAAVAAVLQQVIIALFGIAVDTQSAGGLIGLGTAQIIGSCVSMPFTAVFLVLLFSDLVITQPAAAQQRADWPPPVTPVGPYGPPPAVPPPPVAPPSVPLPDGFLPPSPEAEPRSGALPPPPERPPGAGDSER